MNNNKLLSRTTNEKGKRETGNLLLHIKKYYLVMYRRKWLIKELAYKHALFVP
jgi:hypothetical protein